MTATLRDFFLLENAIFGVPLITLILRDRNMFSNCEIPAALKSVNCYFA